MKYSIALVHVIQKLGTTYNSRNVAKHLLAVLIVLQAAQFIPKWIIIHYSQQCASYIHIYMIVYTYTNTHM